MFGRSDGWRLAAAAAVALSACSGGTDDDSAAISTTADTTSPPSTSAPPTSPPATTAAPSTTEPTATTTQPASTAAETTELAKTIAQPQTEADLAATALWTLDDFPEGWIQAPYDEAAEADAEVSKAQVAECAGVDVQYVDDTVLGDTRADTGYFWSDDRLVSATQTAGYTTDAATSLMAMAALGDDDFGECYADAIRSRVDEMQAHPDPVNSLAPGMTLADVVVNRVDVSGIAAANELVAYEGTITLELDGDVYEQWINLVFMRDARVLANAQFFSNGGPVPGQVLNPLTNLARQRIAGLPQSPNEVGLLTVEDMPEGWTIQPPAENDVEFWDQIAECAGMAPGSVGEAALGDAEVTADDFYDPDGQIGVAHVLGVAPDEATAIAAMAANADEALAGCYEAIITANYAAAIDPTDTVPDLAISNVQVERQDLPGKSGDEMVWYTIVTTFEIGGQTIDRYVELIFLRDGQVLSELQLSNANEPFPEDLVEPMVTRTQERMATLEL